MGLELGCKQLMVPVSEKGLSDTSWVPLRCGSLRSRCWAAAAPCR